ncbi:SDR family NAD(P)-dependent oxidoreductase, partial [Candidatus Dojkabacteria bacterium]|nr:SDR family NAD(P)-dependent oxidoreductase [Candidatus Dojkabacteria bacterium]
MSQVVLITGASSGIGEATALLLLKKGYIVYAAARRIERMNDLKEKGAHILELDITKEDSIVNCVNKVINEQKKIDVLFNNAGYGLYGTVEETSMSDAKNQFEVNLFGLARLTQLVIPHMRKQMSGKIINTSSMGGKVYSPLGAWYHATKHALEGWSDCLRLEMKQFNIKVVVIEPGLIHTDWGLIAADNIERISKNGPYSNYSQSVANGLRINYGSESNGSSPEVIAKLVTKAIEANNPKTRYAGGKYAKLSILIRKIFGDRIF